MATDLPAGWRAYLINLPERRDRLRLAEEELNRIGWRLGSSGVVLYAATKFTDRAGFPSPSVRGCFMSHSDCLRDAIQQGTCNVLMLEDDVVLASTLPLLMSSLLSQLEIIDWDLCYLGHEGTGKISRATARTCEVNLRPYDGELRTTHCYLVNSRILQRLVAHLDRLAAGTEGDPNYAPMPVDGAINSFRLLNGDVRTVIADPKLSWQRPSRSDISPKKFDDLRFLKPVISVLRNLKHTLLR